MSSPYNDSTVLLDPALLEADPSYQRPVSLPRVNKMAAQFDEALFGALAVNQRDDGRYFVYDGWHRRQAAIKAKPGEPVPCLLEKGLTVEQEADRFYRLNGSAVKPRYSDAFKARLTAGEPTASALVDVIRSTGWEIDYSRNATLQPGILTAIATAEKLASRVGADVLIRALRILKRAWANEPQAGTRPMLVGVTVFLARLPQADDNWLVRKLAPVSPEAVTRNANKMVGAPGLEGWDPYVYAIHSLYMSGKKGSNRIPWTEFPPLKLKMGNAATQVPNWRNPELRPPSRAGLRHAMPRPS
jgi:hypothetical protein